MRNRFCICLCANFLGKNSLNRQMEDVRRYLNHPDTAFPIKEHKFEFARRGALAYDGDAALLVLVLHLDRVEFGFLFGHARGHVFSRREESGRR